MNNFHSLSVVFMQVAAYVLIQAKEEDPWQIAKNVSKLKSVKMAHSVTGMYDVIAYVEADDLKAIAKLVRKIHAIKGVERTHTAISA